MSATARPLQPRSPLASRAARTLGVATAAVTLLGAGAYVLSHPSASDAPSSTPVQHMLPLTDRVVPASAFPGYVASGPPAAVRTATDWATFERTPNRAGETAELQRLGFVAGIQEPFRGRYPSRLQAISVVEQFRSPADAHAELLRQFARSATAGSGAAEFAVPGMPGVIAWEFLRPGNRTVNVSFTQGQFYYLLRGSLPSSHNPAPGRTAVAAAAQLSYLLAYGCVARGTTMPRPGGVRRQVPRAYPH